MRTWDYLRGIDDTRQFALFDDPDFVWMQSTGLHDKNGRELYESDWCRAAFLDNEGYHYVQGPISMDEYMWCLTAEGLVNNGSIYSINRLHDWEVIGNVFENPELLTPASPDPRAGRGDGG